MCVFVCVYMCVCVCVCACGCVASAKFINWDFHENII